MSARQKWKEVYRRLRIARRELLKVYSDMILYGSGFALITNEGYVHHVLPQSVVLK